jgi:hypothetical protein
MRRRQRKPQRIIMPWPLAEQSCPEPPLPNRPNTYQMNRLMGTSINTARAG